MLFGLWKKNTPVSYGLVVDIGSGSIGVALVASQQEVRLPELLWSTRRYISALAKVDTPTVQKELIRALHEVFNESALEIQRIFLEKGIHAKLEEIQVTFSAPWAYTISKSVTAHSKVPITLSPTEREALVKKSLSDIPSSPELQHDVVLVANDIIATTANGYLVSTSSNPTSTEITVTHILGLVLRKLHTELMDIHDRTYPTVSIHTLSFMHAYFTAFNELSVRAKDAWLVDVTAETTELALIQDGILRHVSYSPYGTHTLAREISDVTRLPFVESLTYLKGDSEKKHPASLKEICSLYQANLSELISRVADNEAIPTTIFVHTDSGMETFFKSQLLDVFNEYIQKRPTIHTVTSEYFSVTGDYDSALLLSAFVLHNALQSS